MTIEEVRIGQRFKCKKRISGGLASARRFCCAKTETSDFVMRQANRSLSTWTI